MIVLNIISNDYRICKLSINCFKQEKLKSIQQASLQGLEDKVRNIEPIVDTQLPEVRNIEPIVDTQLPEICINLLIELTLSALLMTLV